MKVEPENAMTDQRRAEIRAAAEATVNPWPEGPVNSLLDANRVIVECADEMDRLHAPCRKSVMEEIEAATPFRVRFAFDLIGIGQASRDAMEAIVIRALSGEFDARIDWEGKANG